MGKQHASKHLAQVSKLKKHLWGVTMRLTDGHSEMIDGFPSKREAKEYAAKAPDIIALWTGQGR